LIGLGGVSLAFYFTGRIEHYLHPQFRPWILAAGIIFCFAGVIYALSRSTTQCCAEGECIHQNPNSPLRSIVAFCLLFVPVAAGAAFSKDAFDQQVVLNRGIVSDITKLPGRASVASTQPADAGSPIPSEALGGDADEYASTESPSPEAVQPPSPDAAQPPAPTPPASGNDSQSSEQFLPKSAEGNVALEVTDLLYAESEESLRKMFADKKVEVIGQFLPGNQNNEFKLVRMFMVCCAADARPLAVPVRTLSAITASDMGWVKVVGKTEFQARGERTQVTLVAEKVEPADPPAEAMLY
jgi:uncharacterized repeat protein (TIGR03943 family)